MVNDQPLYYQHQKKKNIGRDTGQFGPKISNRFKSWKQLRDPIPTEFLINLIESDLNDLSVKMD